MRNFMTKAVLGATLAATALTAAAPAEAQRYRHYRHHGGDRTGAAILGGIVGLGVGAAIASSSRDRYYDRRGYYDRGYYDGGYYDRGYYDAPRRYYRQRCYSEWRYDPYYGDRVRVRVCR